MCENSEKVRIEKSVEGIQSLSRATELLASSMPLAHSNFVLTTPTHPAPIGRIQSLTPQSFGTFVPSTASFLTIQAASNDAPIIPPPRSHFLRCIILAHFADNC